MRTRPSMLLVALVLAQLPATRGAADTLNGTKSRAMQDRAHTIELRVDRGHATLVVRRTFDNRSSEFDQAVLDITDMPAFAVATGLRTRSGSTWYGADLLDAEVAAKRYRELTGMGGYYPKDPALLSWRSPEHLLLQVFPVAPKSDKTVEYTLTAPTRWIDGRHELEIPTMGTPNLAPTITLAPAQSGDSLFVDDVPVSSGDTRRLLGSMRVAIAPADAPKLGGRLAAVTFAKDRALLHASIEVGKRLSETPKGAYVIVLVDGSRSLDYGARHAQLVAARAYLGHMTDAKAQVLVFDRVVRPLEPDFVPVSQAMEDLKSATITPRNGSDLDVAFAEAGKRIAAAPTGAPRRILAMTDLATRSTLVPSKITGLDGTFAIVHLATVHDGDASLARDDADPWAAVPRATGGLLWRARASVVDKAADATFEEWARPLRIDRLTAIGVGLATAEMGLPDSLAEGADFEDLRIQKFATPAIELHGELWSTPIATLLTSTPAEERVWSALAMTSPLRMQLRDEEITTLATKGGAVSPMTSYLAIEPGVRPSTEGLAWGVVGEGSGTGSGMGYGGGSGRMGSRLPKLDRAKWLRDEVATIVAGCGGGEALVRVETTWTEIVSVDVVVAKNAKTPSGSCVREGVFGLEPPSQFDEAWRKFEISVP